MKKTILLLISVLTLAFTAGAQPYRNAVGVSFDPDWGGKCSIFGVQWNHFLNEKNSLDIRAGYQAYWGPTVDVTYEWSFPIKDSGFRFYAGPGVHGGFVTDYDGNGHICADFGFTGAVGFEYVFAKVPIGLSIDWRPYLTWEPKVDHNAAFGYKSVAFGVKYCF